MDSGEETLLSYSTFNPKAIKWQYRLIYDIFKKLPFANGTQKVLLSGAVGSAKSTAAAWIACHWCLSQNGAICLIGRKALPDLRDTLYKDIVDMLDNDDTLIDGEDYTTYDTTCRIVFHKTKSEILARTWSDKKYKKARSLRLCLSIIEEGTENNEEDREAHSTILQRLNRLPNLKRNLMLVLTNPDSPSHWIHREYIEKAETDPNTHVYYSLTTDNPYIDQNYVRFLEENLTKPEADRMLRGLWVEIDKHRIYYAYDSNKSFKRDEVYQLDPRYPIDIMADFNIGQGKPMSWALGQVIPDNLGRKTFHVFKEYHFETMRTTQILEEMANDGAFELPCRSWRIFGDATMSSRDTRSLMNDYELIERFIANYRNKEDDLLQYEFCVPRKNPPLRRRHNTANGLFNNSIGETRFFIYKGCDWVDKGFRLTEPKKGADNVEDDGPNHPWQHVTTAITYWADYEINKYHDKRSSMRTKV